MKCLFVAYFRGSEHTFFRLHQVCIPHHFAACGELINMQVAASGFVRVGGSVGLAGAETHPEACPVVTSRTLRLTFVGVIIEHARSTPCLPVHKHTPCFLLIVCVCVRARAHTPWSLGPTLTQSASACT